MKKYRIALVEYLNTLPFSIGINHLQLEDQFEVFSVTPSQCARLFEQGKADISLCPVGALDDLPPHEIRGSYCIGADGPVGTVMLLSMVPLDEIKSVRLDDHSRTSNILLQILAAKWWKKDWDFYTDMDQEMPESCLMIGDKVFSNIAQYPFQYDLAGAWKELTGMPMVFAVWIAIPGIPDEVIRNIDHAFLTGMSFIKSGHSGLADWQISYLLNNISYPLDGSKMDAMHLFFEWTKSIIPEQVNR